MSHPEQLEFFSAIAGANRSAIGGSKVLEIGSYDVNGSIRGLFGEAGTYIGVDLCEGPGVDVVSWGHELDHPDGSYDFTLSGECFEHDPHWRDTFLNMVRMTRPGGLVAFSCASRGRLEHGTRRTNPASSPGTESRGFDYYHNLEEADFRNLHLDGMFTSYEFWYLSGHFDLLFAGIVKGSSNRPSAQLPDRESVNNLNNLMSRPYKLATSPFRILAKVLPESRYQSIALPLSKALGPTVGYFERRRTT